MIGSDRQEGIRPVTEGKLRFFCHPRISCFTACCADLCLILTPYDILRMKKQLRLTSGEFIKQYTQPDEREESIFPMVRLKMRDDKGRRCPFVSQHGCAIYEDRPGACRLYPLGRAAASSLVDGEEGEFYFLVSESHCLGFSEEREWTVEEWVWDQGVKLYNEMNRAWTEIITGKDRHLRALNEQKLGMFHMVSYDLDRFRQFVFQTRFLSVFDVSPEEIERVSSDEVELMKLGMRWLRFALYGDGTLAFR